MNEPHKPNLGANKTNNNMYIAHMSMRYALLGVMAVILAAYPAYADDGATVAQDMIEMWTDIRNNYLTMTYFDESHPTPDVAATETVSSAIEMYEATRAEPQVQVRDRGNFVKHPTNPYGTTVVAFEVINSMSTNEAVYPFVIDAGTLRILAEGAFPGTVGLFATFSMTLIGRWRRSYQIYRTLMAHG